MVPIAAAEIPVTRCIFCGSGSNLTKEHIFSAWTHKFMLPRQPGKDVSQQGILYQARHEFGDMKLPGATRDWQIKCVCGGSHQSCNNGWMREIENRAKPILAPLIRGEAARIASTQQAAIAAWAVLKSMVSEVGFGRPLVTSQAQRQQLRRRMSPPRRGWAVWIGHFDRNRVKTEWHDCRFAIFPGVIARTSADQPPPYYNGNVTNQIIGKLFVQVIHSPEKSLIEGWRYALPDGGTLFRIWPASSFSIDWPGQPMTDADAMSAIYSLPRLFREVSAAMRASEFRE